MNPGRGLALILLLIVASGCTEPQETSAPLPPVTDQTLLEVPPARVRSPDGSMTLIFGGEDNPRLILSAGFFRRSEVGEIHTTSRMAWAPDSRRFYVNDSGSASWSAFRLWSVNQRAEAVESFTIREAAIAELGRLNGCDSVPAEDAVTGGMGWSHDGARVYVLAEVRRQTGDCIWKGVDYILVAADAATGRLEEVSVEADARRRYPTLPWAPVTTP